MQLRAIDFDIHTNIFHRCIRREIFYTKRSALDWSVDTGLNVRKISFLSQKYFLFIKLK